MKNKLIELAYYLLGESPKSNHNLVWDYNRKSCVPTVASPLANYLHEVNRFLFDGGLSVDVNNADSNDPRQQFINLLIKQNKIQSNLESIWETCAITGELLCVIRLSGPSYSYEWFDKTEFDYECDKQGKLEAVVVKATRQIDNVDYIYRLDITSEAYIEYPLVEVRFASTYNWEANKMPMPHTYGMVPAVVIKNKASIGKRRGQFEFNFVACKLAAAIIMCTFDGVENFHLFGYPIFVSPDPEATLKAIKARVQVLQKETNEDGGTVDVLQHGAIKQEHLDLISKLEDNFNKHMGIRLGTEVKSADVSSLTLRILNSATISKAESKWQNYVEDGLKPLFELCLQMAAQDGILLGVNIADYSTYEVTIARKKPYFVESPLEVSQQLNVAQQLVDLGVDRIEALKCTVWTSLTYSQIEEKLRVNLEDL